MAREGLDVWAQNRSLRNRNRRLAEENAFWQYVRERDAIPDEDLTKSSDLCDTIAFLFFLLLLVAFASLIYFALSFALSFAAMVVRYIMPGAVF